MASDIAFIPSVYSFVSPSTFTFLNLQHRFSGHIDWNFAGNGKLWTYNLSYFDFLLQPGVTKEEGLGIVHKYLNDIHEVKDGLEPYPVSLRIINWVKFCIKHNVQDDQMSMAIHGHTTQLASTLEYHLLANHLLENAFAICIGAIFSEDKILFAKGRYLLEKELKEQILPDGAHYERSPMYHQIMLVRLLDLINIARNFQEYTEWVQQLMPIAEKMLGWIKQISFSDIHLPLFNDSAFGIAPTTQQLLNYSQMLGLNSRCLPLKESGFRKLTGQQWELLADVGHISPSYQPGHAHAGTFSFELYIKGIPVIVDTGISTYNICDRRTTERTTKSHNTVTIGNVDSSEVWAGHRVGHRASVNLLRDEINVIEAEHDGYQRLKVGIRRKFQKNHEGILIIDTITTISHDKEPLKDPSSFMATARLHFHPSLEPILELNGISVLNLLQIYFTGHHAIRLTDYDYASEFNTLIPAKVCEIDFLNKLQISLLTL